MISPNTRPRILEFDTFGKSPGYADGIAIRNNIIVNLGEGTYVWGGATNYRFEANCFGGKPAPADLVDPRKIAADPMFTDPGRVAEGIASVDGYRLKPARPAPPPAWLCRRMAGATSPAPLCPPCPIVARCKPPLTKGAGPFPAIVFLHGGGFTDSPNTRRRRERSLYMQKHREADRGGGYGFTQAVSRSSSISPRVRRRWSLREAQARCAAQPKVSGMLDQAGLSCLSWLC